MSLNGLVIEMGKLSCPVCGKYDSWMFIPTEEVFKSVKCSICDSSIFTMEQRHLDDAYIEWIRSQHI